PAIDRPEVAVLVGPFVPDRDAVLVEIFDVGIAAQEPKQLIDDRLDVQLLGGDEREAALQVEAHLMAEDRQRTDAGAVAFFDALGEDAFHQVQILAHWLRVRPPTRTANLSSNEAGAKHAQD